MAILLISIDKRCFQKCIIGGKKGFIVPQYLTHSTKPNAYDVQSYNIKGQVEVKINNTSNYIHKMLLTISPQACQESYTSSPQTLCGLQDHNTSPLECFSSFFSHWLQCVDQSRVFIHKHNCYPEGEFISPGLDTSNHLMPK